MGFPAVRRMFAGFANWLFQMQGLFGASKRLVVVAYVPKLLAVIGRCSLHHP